MNVNITRMDNGLTTEDMTGLPVTIRAATASDISDVQSLDERNTGMDKPEFWADAFRRYGQSGDGEFLVAEQGGRFAGYILAWSRNAGWQKSQPGCLRRSVIAFVRGGLIRRAAW